MKEKTAIGHLINGLTSPHKSRMIVVAKVFGVVQVVMQFKREFLVEQWGENAVEWISIAVISAGVLGIVALRSATTKPLDSKKILGSNE